MIPRMDSVDLIRAIRAALGPRRLFWAGLRADDAASLLNFPQYAGSFSILSPEDSALTGDGISYECLAGARHDLETWDIQDHTNLPEVREFRSKLLDGLMSPSALVTYRPSQLLSAIFLARRGSCTNLSCLAPLQDAFEYKPWVEHELSSIGIPMITWIYFTDQDVSKVEMLLDAGPLVVRRSRTSGGEGMSRICTRADLNSKWLSTDDGLLSVTTFLEDALPINVGATVWNDGVTVHFPSVQLIGVSGCNSRPFGYCGNDFGLSKSFEPELRSKIWKVTRKIGSWLKRRGYLGTFGVDYLLHKDELLFSEINPRFQGSTPGSARLSSEAGLPCLYLEHIAANLGMDAPSYDHIDPRGHDLADLSQVIIHSPLDRPARIDPSPLLQRLKATESSSVDADVLTTMNIVTDPGAVVARVYARRSLTNTGYELKPDWTEVIEDWVTELRGAEQGS